MMSNDAEEKICKILPKNYKYKFVNVHYESDIKHSIVFRVREINDEASFSKWFEEYKKGNKTGWITSRTNFQTTSKNANFTYARDYQCLLSSRNKTADSRRNLDCPTVLRVRVKKNTKSVRYRDDLCKEGFFCNIEISSDHSHPLGEALLYLRVSADTEKLFEEYFNQGARPPEANRIHEKYLRCQPNGILMCADSSLNPPKKWISHKFKTWRDKEVGDVKRLADVSPAGSLRCADSSESDWSDFDEPDEPVNKKMRLNHDYDDPTDDIILNLDKCFEHWKSIIRKNRSDVFLMKSIKRFCTLVKRIETGAQLASFLSNALERHRRDGKKMNANRRKRKSRKVVVLRSGRPIGVAQRHRKTQKEVVCQHTEHLPESVECVKVTRTLCT